MVYFYVHAQVAESSKLLSNLLPEQSNLHLYYLWAVWHVVYYLPFKFCIEYTFKKYLGFPLLHGQIIAFWWLGDGSLKLHTSVYDLLRAVILIFIILEFLIFVNVDIILTYQVIFAWHKKTFLCWLDFLLWVYFYLELYSQENKTCRL